MVARLTVIIGKPNPPFPRQIRQLFPSFSVTTSRMRTSKNQRSAALSRALKRHPKRFSEAANGRDHDAGVLLRESRGSRPISVFLLRIRRCRGVSTHYATTRRECSAGAVCGAIAEIDGRVDWELFEGVIPGSSTPVSPQLLLRADRRPLQGLITRRYRGRRWFGLNGTGTRAHKSRPGRRRRSFAAEAGRRTELLRRCGDGGVLSISTSLGSSASLDTWLSAGPAQRQI